jgi:hypothetical protein
MRGVVAPAVTIARLAGQMGWHSWAKRQALDQEQDTLLHGG